MGGQNGSVVSLWGQNGSVGGECMGAGMAQLVVSL